MTNAQLRRLGRTELRVSPLGIGTWAIGGGGYEFGWGPQDDDASEAAIRAGLDAGMNWIDTAPAYGLGRAERIVARALEGRDDRPYLFTKCSRRWHEDGTFYSSLDRDSILAELDDSLTRLAVDWVDLYQIHRPWPREDLAAAWRTLADLREQGVVRHIGVSYVTADDLWMLEEIAPVETVQPEYNLLRREVEQEVLPWCGAHDTGVIAYSPIASGLLTGKYDRERIAALPADDWRKSDPQFTDPQLESNLRLMSVVSDVAADLGRSPAEVAIAWVLRHPHVTGAIVGFRNAEQLRGLLPAAEIVLDETQVARLVAANRV
jgi:aryl-alcohol dehydrogenase-like predicted oxidoreductase